MWHLANPNEPWQCIDDLANLSFVQASAGEHHSVALSQDGQLYSWGEAKHGKLGSGVEAVDDPTPRKILSTRDTAFAGVSCGRYHSAAVSRDGQVYTWGKASAGQLGHEVLTNHSLFTH